MNSKFTNFQGLKLVEVGGQRLEVGEKKINLFYYLSSSNLQPLVENEIPAMNWLKPNVYFVF